MSCQLPTETSHRTVSPPVPHAALPPSPAQSCSCVRSPLQARAYSLPFCQWRLDLSSSVLSQPLLHVDHGWHMSMQIISVNNLQSLSHRTTQTSVAVAGCCCCRRCAGAAFMSAREKEWHNSILGAVLILGCCFRLLTQCLQSLFQVVQMFGRQEVMLYPEDLNVK